MFLTPVGTFSSLRRHINFFHTHYYTHYPHQHSQFTFFFLFILLFHSLNQQTFHACLFTLLVLYLKLSIFNLQKPSPCKSTTMNFAAFSTLFLLVSTVAATPVNHLNGKWEHSRPSSTFVPLDNGSSRSTTPSGTDTASVTSPDTVPFTQSTASVSPCPLAS